MKRRLIHSLKQYADIPISDLSFYVSLTSDAVDAVSSLSPDTVNNISFGVDGATYTDNSSYIKYADNDVFSFENGVSDIPFSVTFLLNLSSIINYNFIFQKRSTSIEYQFNANYIGGINGNFFSQNGTSNQMAFSSSDGLISAANEFFHITGVYDGIGTMDWYRNGIFFSSNGYELGTYVKMNNTTAPFWLGSDRGQSNINRLNGILKGFGIWKNKMLSSAEIESISHQQLTLGNDLI
jgi:hypothetical protein